MKYNPKVNEDAANLEGFTAIHPLAPEEDVQGCLEVVATLEKYLTQITGMDAFCFQPARGRAWRIQRPDDDPQLFETPS